MKIKKSNKDGIIHVIILSAIALILLAISVRSYNHRDYAGCLLTFAISLPNFFMAYRIARKVMV